MALKDRRVLFISYNGMLDPLGQSQVIPYLRELSKEGVRFTLLSFERDAAFEPAGRTRCEILKEQLARDRIEWHWLRYHRRPSLPATAYDVMAGLRYAQRLARRNSIELVHARSHIPATIALGLKKRFKLKMIFDVRGLMAEEYVDAGHWREGSVPYRLTKRMERRAFRAADGVVTLTESIWPIIKEWDGLRGRTLGHQVIPCCTDLELFKFDSASREQRRSELKLQDSFVLVYSGSIGGWYLTEEMADFFAALLRERTDAHFLWLTTTAREPLDRMMRERRVDPARYTVHAASSSDVPSYLSASDAGIAFIKPCFSKLASSPTKNAEYLACGLPLLLNAGVGDSDLLVTREGVGALVRQFNDEEYAKAAALLMKFQENLNATRRRTRDVAERLFDVRSVGRERYAQLYEEVLSLESGV
ncbi:MAG TPA: glycosyltransferase family 4 protein [Pyrinomonadaceae bacterium]|jgi:glycosyltransferase involved in cell wall biosynthesis